MLRWRESRRPESEARVCVCAHMRMYVCVCVLWQGLRLLKMISHIFPSRAAWITATEKWFDHDVTSANVESEHRKFRTGSPEKQHLTKIFSLFPMKKGERASLIEFNLSIRSNTSSFCPEVPRPEKEFPQNWIGAVEFNSNHKQGLCKVLEEGKVAFVYFLMFCFFYLLSYYIMLAPFRKGIMLQNRASIQWRGAHLLNTGGCWQMPQLHLSL